MDKETLETFRKTIFNMKKEIDLLRGDISMLEEIANDIEDSL